MKKIVSKILIVFNIVLIFALLLLSVALIYSTSSTQKPIFGHTAFLYNQQPTNSTVSSPKLLIITKNNDGINKGDKIIYNVTDNPMVSIQNIDIVLEITGNIACLKDSNLSIDISKPQYIGKVVLENKIFGGILNAISNSKNTTLIYIIICGGAIVISLFVLIIYLSKKRKILITNIANPIEVFIDDDIPNNVFANHSIEFEIESDIIFEKQITKEITIEFSKITEINKLEYREDTFIDISGETCDDVEISEKLSPSIDTLLEEIINQAEKDFHSKAQADDNEKLHSTYANV